MQYSPVVRPIVTAIVDSIVNPDGSATPGNGGGGAGAILKFHALTYDPTTYEMLGVKTGTGGLTTTHTADVYAPDFEGVQRAFGTDEPVWSGGRVVENLLISSQELNASGWNITGINFVLGISDPLGGNTAMTIIAPAANATWFQAHSGANGNYRNSLWMRRRIGTGIIYLRTPNNANVDITTVLTSEWQRITVPVTTDNNGNAYMAVRVVTTGDEIDVAFAQTEFITESSTNQVPSEYIPTTTETVTKAYASTNGNTVTNNVVTEAVGTPLPELPYLQYYPQATNIYYKSNNFQAYIAADGGVGTFDYTQTGIDGTPNTAVTISKTGTGAYMSLRKVNDSDTQAIGDKVVLKVWVKKDNTETNYATIQISNIIDGNIYPTISPSGTFGWWTGNEGDDIQVVDAGSSYIFLIEMTSTRAQSIDVWLYGMASTDGTSLNNGVLGDITYEQVEVHVNKTIAEVKGLGPIFTTTAAVSTDAIEYSFDLANHSQTDGAYYCEAQLQWVDGSVGARNNALIRTGGNGASVLYVQPNALTADEFRAVSYDGANNPLTGYSLAQSPDRATVTYHATDALMAVNFNSNYSPDLPYGGAFDTGVNEIQIMPRVGSYGGLPIQMRNLQRYNIASYQDGKDKIDELMT